ncbi:MAG: hypothetical protein DRJ10_02675, partial [Bacteroidetes bacterium]
GNYAFDASVDIYTPYFTYTPIEPQICGSTSASISVTITDQGTGFPESGVLMPRVYYRDNSGVWTAGTNLAGTFVSQTSTNNVFTSEWTFNLTGLSNSIFYEYYFVAQDQSTYSGSANLGYSKFDDDSPVHADVNTVTTYPDGDVNIDAFTVCVFPSATYTVGNSTDCNTVLGNACDFETLTAAQDFFYNMNAMLIDKDVVCYIVANTTEPATIAAEEFTEDGTGPYNILVRSYDQTAKTLTCQAVTDANMIRFEGGDRYSIDGQYYNAGVPDGNRWLTFTHEDDDQSVFIFKDDAQTDTLKYLTIKASNGLVPYGVIFIDSTTVASPSGNTDIVIDNNIITKNAGDPSSNLIYSYGGGGAENSNISITNNEMSEFKNVGVWVTSHSNSSWTISSNTIYNTYVGNNLESVISINSGSGYTIDGNFIGGSDINLSGAAMENDYRLEFNTIYLDLDDDVISNITNNTIKNITMSEAGTGDYMRGIYVVGGWANITGNTLENLTNNRNNYTYGISYAGASDISISNNTITDFTTNGNGDLRTLYISTDELNVNLVQNNIISNVNMTNTGGNVDFYGIYSNIGNSSITGNIIGGSDVGDKITFAGGALFRAIYINDADADNSIAQDVENNQILNIETTGNTEFIGIGLANMEDEIDMNFQNNTIDNINLNSSGNAICFYVQDGKYNINNNTVGTATNGISNSGTGHLYGIMIPRWENGYIVHDNNITNFSGNADITCISTHTSNQTNTNFSIYDNIISGHTISSEITFTGINLVDDNGSDAAVNGNTITDITMTNTGANTEFIGMRFGNNIDVLVGNTSNNTIGHTSTANSILIAGGTARGISFESTGGNITAQNNLVANITSTGSTSSVQGIVPANTGGTVNVTNNVVRDLNATGTGNSYVTGISIENAGNKTIFENTVYDLTTASTKTDITDGILASQGVWAGGSSSASINTNTIYNITASGTANTNVAAISENATDATITKNKIYDISNTTTGTGTASGIVLYNLNAGYVANNMIAIGEADATEYSGIYIPQLGTGTKNVYFNSVNILNGPTGNSYAFLREDNTTPLNVKNNIFANFASAGSRYAVASKNTSGLTNSTINSNCYFSSNAATTGLWGAVDNDFDTWTSNTGEDDDYLSTNEEPLFVDDANCNLHLSDYNNACAFNSVGELIASVTDDWDGDGREAGHRGIGGDEFMPTAHTGDYVWMGWTDTDWATASNWQCGFAPASSLTEKIVVAEGINNAVVGTDFTTAVLEVKNNGVLNVAEGNWLTVGGVFTNETGGTVVVSSSAYLTTQSAFTNDGTLTLESPANSNQSGSFIDEVAITNNGTFNAERYFTGQAYHYFGIPIQAGASGNATAALFQTSASGHFNANLLSFYEPEDLDGNASTNPDIMPGNNFDDEALYAGWKFVRALETDLDVNLTVKTGYAFYDESNKMITFTGTPNTGDMVVSGLTYTDNDNRAGTLPDFYDGWHLVANPFPSYLDWDMVDVGANLDDFDNAIYVWKGAYDTGQYHQYLKGGDISDDLNKDIAPMQSFFIHATSNSASFTMANTARTHANGEFFKSSSMHNNYLTIKAEKGGLHSNMLVRVKDNATAEFDGEIDAFKLLSTYTKVPQVYTLTKENKTKLSVNSLPPESIEDNIILVGVRSADGGNLTFSLEDFVGFDAVHVYFEDKESGITINIRNQNEYSCNIVAGEVSDRFVLHFNENNTPTVENPFDKQYAEEEAYFSWGFAENVFIDTDLGDTLNYTVKLADGQNLPPWLTCDNANRTFSGTPKNEDIGIITLRLTATDMIGASVSYDFELEVQRRNHAPEVVNIIDDQETTVGVDYSYAISWNVFTDIDEGDKLTLSANLKDGSPLPGWLSFENTTGTFSGIATLVAVYEIVLSATDEFGVSVSTDFKLTVSSATGFEALGENKVSIYPNPSNGKFFVSFDNLNLNKGLDIFIKDIHGKSIYKGKLDDNKKMVDLSGFSKGTYFLEIYEGNNKIVKIVVIE